MEKLKECISKCLCFKSKPIWAKVLIILACILLLTVVAVFVFVSVYAKQVCSDKDYAANNSADRIIYSIVCKDTTSVNSCPEGDYACETGAYIADDKDLPESAKREEIEKDPSKIDMNEKHVVYSDRKEKKKSSGDNMKVVSYEELMSQKHIYYGDKLDKAMDGKYKKNSKFIQFVRKYYLF